MTKVKPLSSVNPVMDKKRRFARQSGFTLIELIVVVIILGILAAVAMPRFINLQRDARIAKLQAARGSVSAGAALVHATTLSRSGVADAVGCAGGSVVASNSTGGSGTVCTENGLINMIYGYPAVTAFGGLPGILAMSGLTGTFNPSQAQLEAEGYTYGVTGTTATFGVIGATDPNTCFFTYTQPVSANSAAVISGLTVSGC